MAVAAGQKPNPRQLAALVAGADDPEGYVSATRNTIKAMADRGWVANVTGRFATITDAGRRAARGGA